MQFEQAKQLGFLVLGCALGIAGCGGDATETQGNESSADAPVRVEVTGDVTSTLARRGSIYCLRSDLGPGYTFELYVMAPPEGFNMVFDRDLSVGEHPVAGADDDTRDVQASFYYRAPDRRRFDRVENGTLVVSEVPRASGESFVAQISATMNDGEGGTISLDADIDVVAGSQTFDECP